MALQRTFREPGLVSRVLLLSLGAALILGAGCSSDDPEPGPVIPPDPETELTNFIRANYPLEATPTEIPYPDNNPPIAERIALGRLLFFDPILSGDRDVACATCHHPAFAWGDARDVSIGVGGEGIGPDRVQTLVQEAPTEFTTPRNSPTVLDTGFNGAYPGDPVTDGIMFWDGRTTSLETQARNPVRSRDEMRHDAYDAPVALTRVLRRLRAIDEYVTLFVEAFPELAATMPAGQDSLIVNGDTYQRAIGAYERELCTTGSPFDQFVGGDDAALTYSQKRGYDLFIRKGCIDCHDGPMFSDYEFHALGVKQAGAGKPPIHEDGDGTDLGRFLETGALEDRYAFRTQTLRNVALTAPYFHTGGLGTGGDYQTLRAVVEFHQRGGNDEGLLATELSPLVRPLELTEQDILDLVAFMESLTATRLLSDLVDPTVPATVPSGLEPPPVLPPSLSNNFGGQ
jgi:cytochrome c peroxidase